LCSFQEQIKYNSDVVSLISSKLGDKLRHLNLKETLIESFKSAYFFTFNVSKDILVEFKDNIIEVKGQSAGIRQVVIGDNVMVGSTISTTWDGPYQSDTKNDNPYINLLIGNTRVEFDSINIEINDDRTCVINYVILNYKNNKINKLVNQKDIVNSPFALLVDNKRIRDSNKTKKVTETSEILFTISLSNDIMLKSYFGKLKKRLSDDNLEIDDDNKEKL